MEASVLYLWMGRISKYRSHRRFLQSGSHTNLRGRAFATVAICIQTGEPVWINGPFPCGSWNDLRIARSALVDALDPGEYYLADGGYRDGNQWSVTPTGHHRFDDRQKSVVRARHETYNKRLKDWGALREVFRHKLETHSQVFRAVANIVQIAISNGETLFEVEYNV